MDIPFISQWCSISIPLQCQSWMNKALSNLTGGATIGYHIFWLLGRHPPTKKLWSMVNIKSLAFNEHQGYQIYSIRGNTKEIHIHNIPKFPLHYHFSKTFGTGKTWPNTPAHENVFVAVCWCSSPICVENRCSGKCLEKWAILDTCEYVKYMGNILWNPFEENIYGNLVGGLNRSEKHESQLGLEKQSIPPTRYSSPQIEITTECFLSSIYLGLL